MPESQRERVQWALVDAWHRRGRALSRASSADFVRFADDLEAFLAADVVEAGGVELRSGERGWVITTALDGSARRIERPWTAGPEVDDTMLDAGLRIAECVAAAWRGKEQGDQWVDEAKQALFTHRRRLPDVTSAVEGWRLLDGEVAHCEMGGWWDFMALDPDDERDDVDARALVTDRRVVVDVEGEEATIVANLSSVTALRYERTAGSSFLVEHDGPTLSFAPYEPCALGALLRRLFRELGIAPLDRA